MWPLKNTDTTQYVSKLATIGNSPHHTHLIYNVRRNLLVKELMEVPKYIIISYSADQADVVEARRRDRPGGSAMAVGMPGQEL